MVVLQPLKFAEDVKAKEARFDFLIGLIGLIGLMGLTGLKSLILHDTTLCHFSMETKMQSTFRFELLSGY